MRCIIMGFLLFAALMVSGACLVLKKLNHGLRRLYDDF